MATQLRVYAVDDRKFPLIDADGVMRVGPKGQLYYAGRDRRTGEPLPGGELVPFHMDYVRAVARGDLADAPPQPEPQPEPQPAAPGEEP